MRRPRFIDPFQPAHIRRLVREFGSPLLILDCERVRVQYRKLRRALRQSLPLPEMRFGNPVDMEMDVATGKLGALLLYSHLGECCRIPPYHSGAIRHLGPPLLFDPVPITRIN